MRAAHTALLCRALEAVERGKIRRLMVEMPPRHSKSLHVSQNLPAWWLGRNPDARIMLASYGGSLASTFSRRVRNTVRERRYEMLFPETRLARDSRSSWQWDVDGHHGGMIAGGVGSGLTGHGADLAIIDDPVKDRKDADSTIMRESTWNWYTSVLRPRLHPGGAIVLCMTRWHHDDLAGRLLAGKDDKDEYTWSRLTFPALAEDDDALGREPGDPLWPERYGLRELERLRIDVGPRDWGALYQQRPTFEEGQIFPPEDWQEYDPETLYWFDHEQQIPRYAAPGTTELFIDTAFKEKETADWSVIAVWRKERTGMIYLLDLWRGHVAFAELKRQVRAYYDKWQPSTVSIEDAASGQSLIQELRRTLPLLAVPAKDDKVSRANSVTPFIAAGRVHLPASHPLLADFIDEHAQFPLGAHDDMVDTTSMALARLARPQRSAFDTPKAEKVSAFSFDETPAPQPARTRRGSRSNGRGESMWR